MGGFFPFIFSLKPHKSNFHRKRYVASSAYFSGSTKDVRYVASSAEAHLTFRFNLRRRDGATCLSRIQREVDKDFVVEECTKKLL